MVFHVKFWLPAILWWAAMLTTGAYTCAWWHTGFPKVDVGSATLFLQELERQTLSYRDRMEAHIVPAVKWVVDLIR